MSAIAAVAYQREPSCFESPVWVNLSVIPVIGAAISFLAGIQISAKITENVRDSESAMRSSDAAGLDRGRVRLIQLSEVTRDYLQVSVVRNLISAVLCIASIALRVFADPIVPILNTIFYLGLAWWNKNNIEKVEANISQLQRLA